MKVVLDTNVFVAAGFNPASNSAAIIQHIEAGDLKFVWNRATKTETRRVLDQIPFLSWRKFEALFTPETEFEQETDPHQFTVIQDPDDRKFAALATASGATLVSNDDHLLSIRDRLDIAIMKPGELMANYHCTSSPSIVKPGPKASKTP